MRVADEVLQDFSHDDRIGPMSRVQVARASGNGQANAVTVTFRENTGMSTCQTIDDGTGESHGAAAGAAASALRTASLSVCRSDGVEVGRNERGCGEFVPRALSDDVAPIDSVSLDQPSERAPVLAGRACGLGDVAVVHFEHLEHVLSFKRLDCTRACHAETAARLAIVPAGLLLGLCSGDGDVNREHVRAWRAHECALKDVVQLTYVARPWVAAQLHEGERRERFARHPVLVAERIEKVLCEQRDVAAAFAQWNHVQSGHSSRSSAPTRVSRSRLVAAMTFTLAWTKRSQPSGRYVRSCRKRRSLACPDGASESISSRNRVPPSAVATRPR